MDRLSAVELCPFVLAMNTCSRLSEAIIFQVPRVSDDQRLKQGDMAALTEFMRTLQ
jgi:hypothetical protein